MTTVDAAPAQVNADQLVLEIMLTPEGRAEPYSRYRALRESAPVHRSAMAPVWFCTRYDDCRAILRDNRFGQPEPDDDFPELENPFFGEPRPEMSEEQLAGRSLLQLNPPDHTRLRGLVSRGFTPKRVDALRGAVEAMTADILDTIPRGADVDMLDVLGFPLPVRVIGELVGVPTADRDQFRPLVRTAAAALEPGTTDEDRAAAQDAFGELRDYFGHLVDARRAEPLDDLTSVLVDVQDESLAGDEAKLSRDELISTLILIFAAGFETTTNLIGNGLYTLLRHPGEFARLRADRSLAAPAVEEILRFESPVQVDARLARVDADIGGRPVTAGEWAVTFLGAANRDPVHFTDPETFCISPREAPPLSFASGIHYCLGASLARLEGQVVFAALCDRFSAIELVEDPTWRSTLILRGLNSLHVSLT